MYNSGEGRAGPEQYEPAFSQNTSQGKVKVEDALSYLDQVKTQFAEEPAVYTQFLDIMKDFKSQAIDTPGVITRVSKLFHGRPALITGFNTFLPPGFEVTVEGQRITIKEPSGNVKVLQEEEPPAAEEQVVVEEKMEVEEVVEEKEMEVSNETHQEEPTPAPTPQETVVNKCLSDDSAPQGLQLNAAIGYVNKIKARFADRPFVYKQFLEILHTYQRSIADQSSTPATEESVLNNVASLFENEPDLLTDFRLFLPDVHGLHQRPPLDKESRSGKSASGSGVAKNVKESEEEDSDDSGDGTPSDDDYNPDDFPLPYRSLDIREILSKTSVEDLAFFEKVRRKVTRSEYETFLRFINLYSASILSARELVHNLQPVLGAYPALWSEMRLRFFPPDNDADSAEASTATTELQHKIDYASCKQLGVSYRSLPDSYHRPICSGRTPLCNEVLNDTWVSFPSWSSEDSSCVASKKTQYEDFVYRTEDERFELDIIIDVNKYAIETLEAVRRKMSRMSTLEQEKYRLDEKLGGTSSSLMSRAIKRIYGEHAAKITEGLKQNPLLAVPKVISRMRDKEREWSEAQTQMNRIWREQNEKHMVRALDHQSNALKTNDAKWIKAKQMITQIEQLFDDRQQRSVEGLCEDVGPHMIVVYPEDRSVIKDATDLIIHYVKRQPNIHKEEKQKIKKILKRYLTEWFFLKPEELSDSEDNDTWPPSDGKGEEDIKEDPNLLATTRSRLVYGGNSLFVFLRLHQIICDRLGKIKRKHHEMVTEYEMEQEMCKKQAELFKKHGKSVISHEKNASDMNNGLAEMKTPRRSPLNLYTDLITDIKNLLDNHCDLSTFEDNVRLMFPVDGYLVFTIDKLISVISRQLVQLASDSDGSNTVKLYDTYRVNKPFSVYDQSDIRLSLEGEYASAAESLLNCQNCFKVFIINEDRPIVTVELVDTETGESGEAERLAQVPKPKEENVVGKTEAEEAEKIQDQASSSKKDKREQPGSKNKIKSTDSRKVSLFLRRNTKRRLKREKIEDMFVVMDATIRVGKGWDRMANKAFEGIIRKSRPSREKLLTHLERMCKIRRSRVCHMFDDDESGSWIGKGMAKLVMRHPDFPFLIYNRYLTRKVHETTRSS